MYPVIGVLFAAVLDPLPLIGCVVRFVMGFLLLIGSALWGFEFVPSPWLLVSDCCFLLPDFCFLACP